MLVTLLLAVSLAEAQTAEDVQAADWKAQEAAVFEEPEADLSLEIGGSYTSGNSEFFTINGALKGAYRFDRNKFALSGAATHGQSKVDADGNGVLDDSERDDGFKPSAARFGGELRYDRFLSPRDSLYALVGGFRDTFAGFDYRLHEQIGYSRTLIRKEKPWGPEVAEGETQPTTKTEWIAEAGIDFAQEDFIAGIDPNSQLILGARVMTQFTHQFTPATSFFDKVELYESFFDPADLRVLNEAAFSTKLNSIISLKLSNRLIFDNVPVEGFRKLDQTTLVTIVADLI